MDDVSDMQLLRDYCRSASEEAFAALVRRHVNLVYSVALRQVGIAAHAEEITQAVFILLARKAAGLRPDTILEGWLHETARLTALSFLRTERRRHAREQEAYMQSTLHETGDDAAWNQLSPLLDEALSRLGQEDRDAVVLRYFKEGSLRDVAAALKVSETAAQRRVLRAVDKLRRFFTKRGVVLPAGVLTASISAHSVHAAPATLAASVSAAALAKGSAAGSSTLTLVKGALKIMAWTKAKTALIAGVIAIVVTSGSVGGYKMWQARYADDNSPGLSPTMMDQLYTVEFDGTVRIDMKIVETNNTREVVRTEQFGDVDTGYVCTDESGHRMKSKKRPVRGSTLFLNKPVPPGQTISYTLKGNIGKVFKKDPSGNYIWETDQQQGNQQDMRLVEVWRLPLGAVLVTNGTNLQPSTNDNGQIELRLDKVVPAMGQTPFVLGYRLAQAN